MNKLSPIVIGCFVCLVLSSLSPVEQLPEILLWPSGAPGSEGRNGQEHVRVTDAGEHVISSVHRPSLTPFIPTDGNRLRSCVIVIPGGGHRELWMDHEGYNPAKWLSDRGVAAFVLKYRLANEENSGYTVDKDELADVQRAIRLVRSRATEWGVDPAKIGVMGFSAGGELAALSAMHFDEGHPDASDNIDHYSCKPVFQALIYPGGTERFGATKSSPPAFLLCGANDRDDISVGLAEVYKKYKEAGVSVELHILADTGHGFGIRATNKGTLADWPELFKKWMDGVLTGK